MDVHQFIEVLTHYKEGFTTLQSLRSVGWITAGAYEDLEFKMTQELNGVIKTFLSS